MSGVAWAFVVTGLLLVAAGFIAWGTWRVRRSTVRWMRPAGSSIAHAIPRTELRAELIEVEALAHCGRWPRAEVARDDGAERCAVCVRAVERVERRHR